MSHPYKDQIKNDVHRILGKRWEYVGNGIYKRRENVTEPTKPSFWERVKRFFSGK